MHLSLPLYFVVVLLFYFFGVIFVKVAETLLSQTLNGIQIRIPYLLIQIEIHTILDNLITKAIFQSFFSFSPVSPPTVVL